MPFFRETIRIEAKGFEKTIENLAMVVPELRNAVKETTRKTMDFAEKEAVKQILHRYQITRDSLMNQTSRHGKWRIKRTEPTNANPSGKLQFIGTRLPVMRFSVSPTTPPNQFGVPVAQRRIVKITTVKGNVESGKPNRFLAMMPTGHIGVYKRKIPNPGGPRRIRPDGQKTQLPISEVYRISVPEMLQGKILRAKFDDAVSKFAQKQIMKELKSLGKRAFKTILENLEPPEGGGGGGGLVGEIEGAAAEVAEGAITIAPELLL